MGRFKDAVKAVLPEGCRPAAGASYRRTVEFWYRGDRRVCPCCGGHYRTFRSYGRPRRRKALCPGCGSLERHRLLWLYLRERTDLFCRELKVFHAAPAPVFYRVLRALPNLFYVPADLDSPLAGVVVDLTAIPCRDGAFDAVLCVHVLEHVLDDRRAMRELYRVLKPGGWAILQSPVDGRYGATLEGPEVVRPEDRARLFGQRDHVRRYGRDYTTRLEAAGFAVRVDPYAQELDADRIETFGLMGDEAIYFCMKGEG